MKLIVLDFYKDITYIYTMNENDNEHNVDEFLVTKGHRLENCQWMLTKNEIIIKENWKKNK
mgnify:CR=1 FL=1|tara:strand:+ start:867 stop:1049 length:183 start_codon:yes stop_codon:yes gene_type:complete